MKLSETLIAIAVAALLIGVAAVWLMSTGLRQAPPVTLTTLQGEQLTLADLAGRPVLVTFWATTCPGCIKEIPDLIALHEEFAARGLSIIGIAMSYDPPNQVNEMTRRKQLPYTVALDIDGTAARAFGNVRLTPTNILIAPDGRIVQQKIGEYSETELAQLRARIISMLAGQGSHDAPPTSRGTGSDAVG